MIAISRENLYRLLEVFLMLVEGVFATHEDAFEMVNGYSKFLVIKIRGHFSVLMYSYHKWTRILWYTVDNIAFLFAFRSVGGVI